MIFSHEIFNVENSKKKHINQTYIKAKKKVLESLKNKSWGFLKDLYVKDYDRVLEIAKKLRKFNNILFLGTGGSSLGGKTLVTLISDYFYNLNKPKVFFIENIDSKLINDLLKRIDLKKTALVVTSKSGETIETISQFFYIENNFQKRNIPLKGNVYVITENKKSTLKLIQEERGFDFFPHPKSVGGRYSVFSIVGLLPAALAEFKIRNFCNGAKRVIKLIQDEKKFDELFIGTYSLIKLNRKGVNMTVMMPYSDSLLNLSLWFRQLWAESIGKEGKGITPINAVGTIDQHSQLQLFLDGPKDKFFTIIGKILDKSSDKIICDHNQKNEFVMNKKSLERLMDVEMRATIQTLKNKGLPIRVIMLKDFNESSIGSLMMFLLLETIFACLLLEIDPFDQPAVEEGKNLAKKYLEKNE